MTHSENPTACSCSLDQSALSTRLAAWRRVAAQGRTVEVGENRVVAAYPRRKAILDDLQALVAAEAECCSFLTFTIEERGDEIVSELSYPSDIPAPLRAFIAELTSARLTELNR